jgi:uncharacterized membrane protein
MPYEWLPPAPTQSRLHLWPHRSLNQRGFVGFFGATSALALVPALAVIGSPVLWGVLPFFLIAIGGVWAAIRRNQRDTEIIEDLVLARDNIHLTRHGPRGKRQDWQANPHWVQITLHPTGGPVPNYLTLRGSGREVELGAFLSEDERIALSGELRSALQRLR